MKRAFISFDYDHDIQAKIYLAGQSKNPSSPFEFKDNSVKEHLTGDWEYKVSRRMESVDVVIFLCGEHTSKATGVSAELAIVQKLKKPYFFLAAYSDKRCELPRGAKVEDKLYKWTWENLNALIAGRR